MSRLSYYFDSGISGFVSIVLFFDFRFLDWVPSKPSDFFIDSASGLEDFNDRLGSRIEDAQLPGSLGDVEALIFNEINQ